MRLLQVREKNEQMTKDWLLFLNLSKFKVTAAEIFEAFCLAMQQLIVDENGKPFRLLPELSNQTTAKVILSYIAYKKNNNQYQVAKEQLKLLISQKNDPTEQEKKQLHQNFLKMVFDELHNTPICYDAWLLYDKLLQQGKISPTDAEKKEAYHAELVKYIPAEKDEIRAKHPRSAAFHLQQLNEEIKQGKVAVVINRAKAVIVSQYLQNFLHNFETFTKIFEP